MQILCYRNFLRFIGGLLVVVMNMEFNYKNIKNLILELKARRRMTTMSEISNLAEKRNICTSNIIENISMLMKERSLIQIETRKKETIYEVIERNLEIDPEIYSGNLSELSEDNSICKTEEMIDFRNELLDVVKTLHEAMESFKHHPCGNCEYKI